MINAANEWEWGLSAGGWVLLVILWLLVVLGIIYLYKLFTTKLNEGKTVIQILNKKYLKGQISREEFERMQQVLKKD